jgi:hypothetical protein
VTIFYYLKFETPRTWRARSPNLYPPPPGTGRPGYTPRHWAPFSSPPTTGRTLVPVVLISRHRPRTKHRSLLYLVVSWGTCLFPKTAAQQWMLFRCFFRGRYPVTGTVRVYAATFQLVLTLSFPHSAVLSFVPEKRKQSTIWSYACYSTMSQLHEPDQLLYPDRFMLVTIHPMPFISVGFQKTTFSMESFYYLIIRCRVVSRTKMTGYNSDDWVY